MRKETSRSFRKSLAILLSGACLFGALAGCGSDPSGASPSNSESPSNSASPSSSPSGGDNATVTPASGEPVEITFTHWGGDGTYEGCYQARVEAFMQDHPDIKVNMLTIADDYETKLQTSIVGNKAPDVIQVAENGMGFASKGAFVNLNDRVAAAGLDTEKMWGNVTDEYTYNGELFALPDRGGCTIMYYNKDLFDEAGVAYPTTDWTLDDYFSAIEKITADTDGDGENDRWGTTSTHYQAIWGYMLQANGGNIIKDGEVVINSPQNLEMITRYNDAYQNGWIVPYEELEQANSGGDAYFQQGRLGMNLTGMWCIKGYSEEEGLNFGITTVPKGMQDAGWPMGSALAISSQSSPEKQEAAWTFIQYMTSYDAQQMLGQGLPDCPASLEVLASDDFINQTFNGKELDLDRIAVAMERVTIDGIQRGEFYNEAINECRNQIKEMLLGRLTPTECLEKLQTELENIVAQY